MSPNTIVLIKLFITFLFSGIIFLVMMRREKKRERDADLQFEMTLKSRGLSSEVIKEKKDE